ncbi:hypothetical protein QYE76_051892 [Lolium multiflorum]|uniref:HhH-GPD domain-containing protein n=1 Tax=Lolium multiflorum TaxID=4521 RepID=A0AAD8SSP5_LOLMU|nr:hypothetical protein QYE76_051892 [Lolium multiflorum]
MEQGDTPNSGPPVAASVMAAAAMGESQCEATRQKRRKKKPNPDGAGFGLAPSQSPLPAATFLQIHTQSPAPGTPILEEAADVRKRKVRKDQKAAAEGDKHGEEPMLVATTTKKKHRALSAAAAAAAAKEPILQQGPEVNTKQKRNKEEGPSTAQFLQDPAQSRALGAQILEEAMTEAAMRKWKMDDEKRVAVLPFTQNQEQTEERVLTVTTKKKQHKHRERKSSPSLTAAEAPILQRKQQEPSGKSPLSLHPGQTHSAQSQGGKAPPEQEREADAQKSSSIKKSNAKMPSVRVLSKRKLIKEASKRQPVLPEGFVPFSDFVSNCTEQNPDGKLPYSAFFDQFRYNPVRGDHKPPLPRTPDRLARLLPRANGTSKASKTNNSVVCKSKNKDSGPGSASGSQEKLHPQKNEKPEKMGTTKQRKPPPLLTRAEKCSDIYRRVPLDQLVPPPCSPHNLLQEKYASDPWKVIVICMLLNLTQGKQVKNIIEGFFKRYPDAHSAINADPEKMEGYLAYLGLQHVKTTRIQKFSKEYVEKEWTHIYELCGVGKYAADAYAIFCAGRAIEVVPEDHKLVDYWKYVCFELPLMQKSRNAQEAGVQEQELAVMR